MLVAESAMRVVLITDCQLGLIPFVPGVTPVPGDAGALRNMKRQADHAIAIDGTHRAVDPVAMAAARHHYHSAVLIGEKDTATRAGPLMKKHHALARPSATGRTTTSGSPPTLASPSTTTPRNVKYRWGNCGSSSPDA